MPATFLGLDVGGANLKSAHPGGAARSIPFPLWRRPADLPGALHSLLASLPPANGLAVTMTGELCDCFATKREGIRAILAAVEEVAGERPVRVWTSAGRFVGPVEVRADPLPAAAANWLALATFAGRFAPRGPALLVDVGSTTSDIVPVVDGRPVPRGRTDSERLRAGELVYTGVRRTPLCALLGGEGAAELFATARDAYLVLGSVAEDPADRDTADGRPATRAAAHARLARMLCADAETSTEPERADLAARAARRQSALIGAAIARVARSLPGPSETVLLAGEGEFLAARVLEGHDALGAPRVVSLGQLLGPEASRAACALAVAVLAGEQ
jgi:probable H4MPT-linked C1 transfer pathway protein